LSDTSSVYLAQSDKASLDVTIANTESDATTTLNSLKASIGVGVSNAELDLDGSYGPRPKDDISFWDSKVEDLPSIVNLKTKAQASGESALSQRQLALPTLGVIGDYGNQNTAGVIGPQNSFFVSANITIPIFDQGLRSIAAQQADSQKMVSEALVLSTKESQMAEIKNLIKQWQSDEKVLDLAKIQLENAQKGYEALVTLYSFGKTSFIAVQNAESSLNDSEIQLETIETKLASEKAVLELLGNYSGGRPFGFPVRVKCPGR
jgi:outer membrane protein TolC